MRDRIPGEIRGRKTLMARDVLRRLAKATGERSLLIDAIDAEALALADAWSPPSPGELVHLLRDGRVRLVNSESQLLDVVIESLTRLQAALQGEIPEVQFLWDGIGGGKPRPKDEQTLSDYVATHLKRDLQDRSVVVGREVQIRRRLGARAGENTDIHVDAVGGPDPHRKLLSVIVESKGNWNRGLETDIKNQLAGRYLADNDCRSGIYLVGWYSSSEWDAADWRKDAAERLVRDSVLAMLRGKAEEVSRGGIRIEVAFLDARL
jgi:hypothetical protein